MGSAEKGGLAALMNPRFAGFFFLLIPRPSPTLIYPHGVMINEVVAEGAEFRPAIEALRQVLAS